MYVYNKKSFTRKAVTIVVGCVLLVIGSIALLNIPEVEDDVPVAKINQVPFILTIPSEIVQEEKAIRPYAVDATLAREYFDVNKTEEQLNNAVVEFEGVYRANQGADYKFENERVELVAIFSGVVAEVREDALLGKMVSIQSDDCLITYQSLYDIQVSTGENVMQGEVIAAAGENIYDSSLGVHLHLVVMKNEKLIDPETIFSKTLAQIE